APRRFFSARAVSGPIESPCDQRSASTRSRSCRSASAVEQETDAARKVVACSPSHGDRVDEAAGDKEVASEDELADSRSAATREATRGLRPIHWPLMRHLTRPRCGKPGWSEIWSRRMATDRDDDAARACDLEQAWLHVLLHSLD